MRTHRSIISAGLALWLGIANHAVAAPVDDAVAAAMKDAEQGRCRAAVDRLASMSGLQSRARLLGGQCLVAAGRYPEALADLNEVRGAKDLSSSQVGDVELFRGVALYHLERYTEATSALDAATGLTAEEAQLSLYRGLIALRSGDNDRAAPALETAARLAPAQTEPVASYYAGLAWQGSSERTKAREAFRRVIAVDGEDGAWGKQAAALLENSKLFPFYVRLSAGAEFDDNVILRGGVTQFSSPEVPAASDGQEDWRGVWSIDAGVQLFRHEDWSGGLTASYYGNVHQDLGEFDTHYPTIGAYLANQLDANTVARARYNFGFVWLDNDSFMRTQIVEAALSHTWEKAGTTTILADVLTNDLRFQPAEVRSAEAGADPGECGDATPFFTGCGPDGLNESRERNRDGVGYGAAIEHLYPVPIPVALDEAVQGLNIGGGYRFRYYDAEGDEWEHQAHVLSAVVNFDFPLGIQFRNRASYEFREFENPSTFPDAEVADLEYTLAGDDRSERQFDYTADLEKDIWEGLSVSARWSYTHADSNRRVYSFKRHIAGMYLNYRFD
ncbi:MAG: tetratricopeptide repeat protein [Myxococcota bacterium]